MNRFPMEIQDQMNYFAFKVCNQMLHCVLYFNGRIDETLLRHAVRLSLKTYPILNCRLVRRDEVYWETSSNQDNTELFEMVITDDVKCNLDAFLIQAIDVEAGPLVRVRLFRAEKDMLCIKLNHAIGDAGALKAYTARLAGLYTALTRGESAPEGTQERRDQRQFMESLPQDVAAELQKKSAGFTQNMVPNWSFPSKSHSHSHLAYAVCRLDGKKIKSAARKANATLNDYLLAAFCRALLTEGGHPADRPMLVQVPVDLRRYLADGTNAGICNISGAEYLNVEISREDNFTAVLAKVLPCMKQIKSNHPGLLSAFALEGLAVLGFEQAMQLMQGNMEMGIEHNVSIPLLTNMGVIPDEAKQYGDMTAMDGYLVSPVMYAPGFMVGTSSFGDTLTLTLGFDEEATGRDVAERFLDRMALEMKGKMH